MADPFIQSSTQSLHSDRVIETSMTSTIDERYFCGTPCEQVSKEVCMCNARTQEVFNYAQSLTNGLHVHGQQPTAIHFKDWEPMSKCFE